VYPTIVSQMLKVLYGETCVHYIWSTVHLFQSCRADEKVKGSTKLNVGMFSPEFNLLLTA
jgi:hypothetical protein